MEMPVTPYHPLIYPNGQMNSTLRSSLLLQSSIFNLILPKPKKQEPTYQKVAVIMATMTWRSRSTQKSNPPPTLGILAFETATTMSRLLALYKSLSDDEFFELRKGTMKSRGVAFLNSTDESYLFSLACAEKLEELNRVAISASRLAQRCSDSNGNNFDPQLIVCANDEKAVQKMEKYVSATANLYTALETLNQMELSEKKVNMWKLNVDPKRSPCPNFCYFDEKIAYQRKQVQYYKNTSLWSHTFDKIVALMSRIVYAVYSRICIVFGPFVSGLPCFFTEVPRKISLLKPVRVRVHPEADYCLLADRNKFIQERAVKSGPIPRTLKKSAALRFYSHELLPKHPAISSIAKTIQTVTHKTVIESAPPSTVGAVGLAMRYANIIVLAERYLTTSTYVNDEARGILYEMLPARIKTKLREKMRGAWGGEEEQIGNDGSELAEGWRQAVEEIMTWLAPMAQDTVTWRMERNLEKQRFDTQPVVLLLQTLHFSDLEKTEAAIVEVLVGLSCIYRYENQWLCNGLSGSRSCR